MGQARVVFSREIDLRPLWHALRDHPADVICWLGVLLRVGAYLWNRRYWMDEGTLLGNLAGDGGSSTFRDICRAISSPRLAS